ncbi:MAG: hypothetical protein M1840_003002 [Geoglossum simile]|nr:MAG: hypothetical protein M1840_003002 [Geoglossum simile]
MEAPPTPTPASRSSRMRAEDIRAKIKARGRERIGQINNMKEPLNEKPKPSVEPTPSENVQAPMNTPPLGETVESKSTPDPGEIDISGHHYVPGARPRPSEPLPSQQSELSLEEPSPEELLRIIFGNSGAPQGTFAPGPGGMGTGGGDPLSSMLRQIIGGDSTDLSGDGVTNGLSPGANLQQRGGDNSGFVWRIIHAIFALVLAAYIVFSTSFVGTHASRLQEPPPLQVAPGVKGVNFFWLFATVELVLQSTRFFLEKGRAPPDSWLGRIAGYFPTQIAGYLVTLARYSVIYTMVVQDGMLIVFVLGCVAWWNGGVRA